MATTTGEQKEQMNVNCNIDLYIEEDKVDPKNINRLVIREWVFDEQRIPRIDLVILDDGFFSDARYPYQGKTITVNVKRDLSEATDSYLSSSFKILNTSWKKSQEDSIGSVSTLIISGLLEMTDPFLDIAKNIYEDQSTTEIIKSLAGELGVGFINNLKSNDKMNWIARAYTPKLQYIDYLVKRSWIADDDCFLLYFDTKKNLNYSSLKTSIDNSVRKSTVYDTDMAIINTKKELVKKGIEKFKFDEQDIMSIVWYTNLEQKNIAGTNFCENYGFGVTYWWVDIDSGQYSFTDPSKNGTTLQKTSKYFNSYDTFNFTNEDPNEIAQQAIFGNYIEYFNYKQIENVFGKEYYYSSIHRENIITSFASNAVVIEMNPTVEVNLLDVLYLDVPSNIPSAPDNKNAVIGGEYVVCGIIHLIDKGYYKKMLSLHRAGFNASTEIK